MHRDKITNEQIIKVLEKNMGLLASTARSLGVSRATLYNWINNDDFLKEEVKQCRESVIDFAESKLFERVKKEDTTAIIYLLKTLGKSRGYVERFEHQEHIEQPLFPEDEHDDNGVFISD